MKKILFPLVALIAFPVFAQTVPSRVAVINVQKVLTESTQGQAAFQRLKSMQEERAVRIAKMEEDLRKLESEITSKQMSLSEDKLGEMRKQFSDKKIALQRFAQDAERELTEARDTQLQQLESLILPVINEVGKEMGFAVIFNKFESGLVYASEAVDVTDVVVKRFNEKAVAPKAAQN